MALILNPDEAKELLFKRMNKELEVIGEAAIEKALKEIEKKMRERLGGMLIGMIEQNFDLQSYSDRIVITLNQVKEKK